DRCGAGALHRELALGGRSLLPPFRETAGAAGYGGSDPVPPRPPPAGQTHYGASDPAEPADAAHPAGRGDYPPFPREGSWTGGGNGARGDALPLQRPRAGPSLDRLRNAALRLHA